jgi:hypothetical protein
MMKVSEWKRKLKRLGAKEFPRTERLIPSGFVARLENNPASKLARIGNISSTGVYLVTEERWPLGELVSLTLQGEGSPEDKPELQIVVQARVIRHGEDGMGLSFVLPTGLDLSLWGVLIRNAVVMPEQKDVLFMFRMLRTILFLCRICQAAASEAILLFGGELSGPRTENALEIALGAELLLGFEPHADRMRADPQLVASILRNGSWADDDLIKRLWKGLMTSSCTLEGTDQSNKDFVDALFNITPAQGLIFVAGCQRVMELTPKIGDLPSTRIILGPEEITRITDMTDRSRIATNLSYLYNLGLIESNYDFTSYVPAQSFDITPSRLGLKLFNQCKGSFLKPCSRLDKSEDAPPEPESCNSPVYEVTLPLPLPEVDDKGP